MKPNPVASLETFGAPGPFTAELNDDLASLAFNATGGNNVILLLSRQNQIDGLHRQGGAVSFTWMLSPVRYIVS